MGKRTMSRRSFVGAGSLSAAALGMLLAGCGTTQQQSGSSNQTDAAKSDSLVAKTAYGPVKSTNEDGVNIWYGVPYGKSPEGELRWQAPESWTEERDCTQPAQPALQYTNNEVTGTEDCSTSMSMLQKAQASCRSSSISTAETTRPEMRRRFPARILS